MRPHLGGPILPQNPPRNRLAFKRKPAETVISQLFSANPWERHGSVTPDATCTSNIEADSLSGVGQPRTPSPRIAAAPIPQGCCNAVETAVVKSTWLPLCAEQSSWPLLQLFPHPRSTARLVGWRLASCRRQWRVRSRQAVLEMWASVEALRLSAQRWARMSEAGL